MLGSQNPLQNYARKFSANCSHNLRTRPHPTGVKIPKSGKRGFRGQETPIAQCPTKGRFESRIPIFFVKPVEIWGFFESKRPFLGHWEMGVFGPPKPSFPDFGDFDPFRGRTCSQFIILCRREVNWNADCYNSMLSMLVKYKGRSSRGSPFPLYGPIHSHYGPSIRLRASFHGFLVHVHMSL